MSMGAEPIPGSQGLMDDPLSRWGNDDLMLRKETRDSVEAARAHVFRVVDWPEMRSLFEQIDERSKEAKKYVHRTGIFAVAVATTGLILSALASWLVPLGSAYAPATGRAAALLVVCGLVLGFWPLLRGRRKREWLATRLQAERLRQLHFQLIFGNFALAARAMTEDGDLEELRAVRAKSLQSFRDHYVTHPDVALNEVFQDEAELHTWIDSRWDGAPPPGTSLPAHVDDLLQLLRMQRFGVQKAYAESVLSRSIFAPDRLSAILRFSSDWLTVCVLLFSLVVAAALMFGIVQLEFAAVALMAASAACVTGLRTLEEGLRYGDAASRMGWYKAAIEALEKQWGGFGIPGQVQLFKRLEQLAYREMRQFLLSHDAARFVIQ